MQADWRQRRAVLPIYRRRVPKPASIDGNVEAPRQSTIIHGTGIDASVGTKGRNSARDGLTMQSSDHVEVTSVSRTIQ